MEKQNHRDGFTLVELAIVLVIIGLVVGGVIVGQAIIEQAKNALSNQPNKKL